MKAQTWSFAPFAILCYLKSMHMSPEDITDEQLLCVVSQTDAELFRTGIEIKQRYWQVPVTVMQKFGYVGFVMAGSGKPKILDRIESVYSSIYRKQDFVIGGHIGVYMYRDIFARISIPHVYGAVAIDPFNYVDLTDVQKRMMASEPEEVERFLNQFSDVIDLEYGSSELKPCYAKIELAARFADLSRLHLHAAAAIVTGGYDYRGAVQNVLLATELSLKSAAAAQGLQEEEIKNRFGHDLRKLVGFIETAFSKFDSERVSRVVGQQPKYVLNRYSSAQPNRIEVGHIVMGAQFVAAEVVRQLSERDFRSALNPAVSRRYPA
jgi:hypothetical protein